jgi:hypothetical protein
MSSAISGNSPEGRVGTQPVKECSVRPRGEVLENFLSAFDR